MPRISLVYLNIDGFEIREITRHSYQSGKAEFKFNRSNSNDRIYIHLKSKENKHMKLIYKNEKGLLRADSHLTLTSITCKDGVITVNMDK
jgi:hypothetical protein